MGASSSAPAAVERVEPRGVEMDLHGLAQRVLVHALLLDHPVEVAIVDVDEGLRARDLGQLDRGVDRDVALVLAAHGQMVRAHAQRMRRRRRSPARWPGQRQRQPAAGHGPRRPPTVTASMFIGGSL